MNLETASPLYGTNVRSAPAAKTEAICPETLTATACIKKEVLIILLLAHFVDDASGHGERRNACCPNHGVDLLPFRQEQVYQFRHKHASGGVQHEARKA